MAESKRRRVDTHEPSPFSGANQSGAGGGSSRKTAGAGAGGRAAAANAANAAGIQVNERQASGSSVGGGLGGGANGGGKDGSAERVPVFQLNTLPPAALQRYLSRYNLLSPHGTLSYHHAVFPTPPLPLHLTPPLSGRTLIKPRPRLVGGGSEREYISADGTVTRKRLWVDPKTREFEGLGAWDDGDVVTERLAKKAKAHYDEKTLVKEGETLTNFIFALRMRAHTLRATPPG